MTNIMLLWLLLIVLAAHKKELFDVTIATAAVSSDDSKSHNRASHNISHQCHLFIGIAMTIGFVFMLLIDQLGGSHDISHQCRWLLM